jgi:hypothetical protein
MEHKLTKFQIKTWEKLQPKIKNHPYEVKFNFDDEFVITQNYDDVDYTITVFPKEEISFKVQRTDGGNNLTFYSIDNFENLLKDLDNLISK